MAKFRADQVGSLLRPAALKQAHEDALAGRLRHEALREIEDRHIGAAIRRQEEIGLQSITDGEFRRTSFHADFLERLTDASGSQVVFFRRGQGSIEAPVVSTTFTPPSVHVTGKLHHPGPIELSSFTFVKSHSSFTPKVTLPSPTMLLRSGRDAVSREAYPDLDAFYEDVAAIYRAELAALAAAGCTVVQLDDTNYAYLCDHDMRQAMQARGLDVERLPGLFADVINSAIGGRPASMTIGIHLCRGNGVGRWAARGGYEPIAEALFKRLNVDSYFLEYDSERAGDFSPLRFAPQGKHVVLGLVSTKTDAMEHSDDLKRRIEEAARVLPIGQIGISPQCGFASNFRGNPIDEDAQWRKLALCVETAREVWGTAGAA
jgi:5-methyltetrahydropteroyltriglutamate--homocysteine methyltransferase